jgi:phage major head subunit gpT-like protein
MAGVINTGSIAKAIWPGVNKFYGLGYNEHPLEYNMIFDVENSTKLYEEDVILSGTGLAPKKPEGESVSYDSIKQGWTTRYTNVVYALGIQVTREMIEDDQYDLAFKKARYLGRSIRLTQETISANVLNRAFNSSYVGGDGLEMCSTAHLNVAGGTFSNELTTSADLSEASLEQACIDIAGFTDDRGLQIAANARKLIIPRQLKFEAHRILKSTLQSDSANNAVNALKNMDLEIVMNHYLTDADAWFLKTDVADGLKYFNRRAPEFKDDNDFDTENAKFKGSVRLSVGWSDPRGIFGSPGA